MIRGTRWNETRQVRWEVDWHRSTNTRQTSLEMILLWTNRAVDGVKPGTRWQLMPPWEKIHCLTKSLEEVVICKPAQSVFPPVRLSSHVFFVFFIWRSLTFSWTALSGFQSIGNIFLFYARNFCLDRPFRFSVHWDALYCLSRLFRFST